MFVHDFRTYGYEVARYVLIEFAGTDISVDGLIDQSYEETTRRGLAAEDMTDEQQDEFYAGVRRAIDAR
jgi:hypothetical protein